MWWIFLKVALPGGLAMALMNLTATPVKAQGYGSSPSSSGYGQMSPYQSQGPGYFQYPSNPYQYIYYSTHPPISIYVRKPTLQWQALDKLTYVPPDVVITIPSSSGGNYGPQSGQAGKTRAVAMYDSYFTPAHLEVSVGTTVHWVNHGQHTHSISSEKGEWESGQRAPGETFSYTFKQPGLYPYYCKIHPQKMRGTILVK